MELNEQVRQGHFGEGFIWALSCAAGLNPGKRVLDVDGVDIQIGRPGRHGKMKAPTIEAQIKSWSTAKVKNGFYPYSLPVSNFNNLVGVVGEDLAVPRYLFLVVVPPDFEQYCHATAGGMTLCYAAYWHDLMHEDEVDPDTQESKTVYVPQANLLTATSLRELTLNGWNRRAA